MTTTHNGSCHCGAVEFEVDADLSEGTSRCNCSLCSKLRYWYFTVGADAFRLRKGEDVLSDYQIDSGSVHHKFCSTCGVKTFGHGIADELDMDVPADFYSVNVACLDDLSPAELADLDVGYVDGRNDDWGEEPAVTSHL